MAAHRSCCSGPTSKACGWTKSSHRLAIPRRGPPGVYGEILPASESAAPIRLVTPWKYGFKGAKSIVQSEFVE
jgi:hypothetical protein